jgi:primosomal protein N' (replication factor Y)
LHLPDFRAAERTCQLLVQVAGRTGRGDKGGRVLVQTSSPEHAAIKAAVKHDYRTFVEQELPLQQMLAYPPLATMIRLVIRGPQEATAKEFAAYLAERISAALCSSSSAPSTGTLPTGVRVLGPAVCPFAKLRGNFRFQIHLQSPDGDQLRTAIRAASVDLKPPENVQWIVDVDPWEML